MKIYEIELLITTTEMGITVIEKSFYYELVERLKRAKRKNLLDRLLKITPYEEKENK